MTCDLEPISAKPPKPVVRDGRTDFSTVTGVYGWKSSSTVDLFMGTESENGVIECVLAAGTSRVDVNRSRDGPRQQTVLRPQELSAFLPSPQVLSLLEDLSITLEEQAFLVL